MLKSPDEVVVDMRLTVMKEIGARWLVSMYDYFQSRPEICRNGFVKAGIVDAISNPDNIAPASRDRSTVVHRFLAFDNR